MLQRDFRFTAMLTLLTGLGLGAASLIGRRSIAASDRSAYFLPLARPAGQIALLLAASGAFVLARCARDALRAGVFLGVGWGVAWLLLIRLGRAGGADLFGGRISRRRCRAADRGAPMYSVRTYDQSFTFYLQRTVTLVAYRGELDYGLRHAPGAEIADVAEFLRRWSAQARAFAVMENRMFDDLKDRGVPMRVVARSAQRVLVARQ